MKLLFWIVLIISAALMIAAQITLKVSLRSIDLDLLRHKPFYSLQAIAMQPLFWVSIFLSGLVFALTIYNLISTPLSTFAPLYIIIYFFGLLLFSSLILRENISMTKIAGYVCLTIGLILISAAK